MTTVHNPRARALSGPGLMGPALAIAAAALLLALSAACGGSGDSRDAPETGAALTAELEDRVRLDPQNPTLRVQLAVQYGLVGNEAAAGQQLDEALRIDDTNQEALIAKGDLSMDLGRWADAVEAYSKVAELNKDNPLGHASNQMEAVYYRMGTAHSNQGNNDAAANAFETALRISPTDADAHYQVALIYRRQGRQEDAIASLRTALSFVPDFIEAYEELSELYDELGDAAMGGWARSMVRLYKGDYAGAVEDLRGLLRRVPDSPEIYVGLGLAFEKADEPDLAMAAYENVLDLDPDHWLARQRLRSLSAAAAGN